MPDLRSRGFTLVELAIVVLILSVVGASLEEVLARLFAEFAVEEQAAAGAPASYSDASGPERRLVYLSGFDFDADGDGTPDPGILRVRGRDRGDGLPPRDAA